jgi:hypothetical protein
MWLWAGGGDVPENRWCQGYGAFEAVRVAPGRTWSPVAPVAVATPGISMARSAGLVAGVSGPGMMVGPCRMRSHIGSGAVAARSYSAPSREWRASRSWATRCAKTKTSSKPSDPRAPQDTSALRQEY